MWRILWGVASYPRHHQLQHKPNYEAGVGNHPFEIFVGGNLTFGQSCQLNIDESLSPAGPSHSPGEAWLNVIGTVTFHQYYSGSQVVNSNGSIETNQAGDIYGGYLSRNGSVTLHQTANLHFDERLLNNMLQDGVVNQRNVIEL